MHAVFIKVAAMIFRKEVDNNNNFEPLVCNWSGIALLIKCNGSNHSQGRGAHRGQQTAKRHAEECAALLICASFHGKNACFQGKSRLLASGYIHYYISRTMSHTHFVHCN